MLNEWHINGLRGWVTELANDTVQLNILLKIQYQEITTVSLVSY
jgi:hypothetical protein